MRKRQKSYRYTVDIKRRARGSDANVCLVDQNMTGEQSRKLKVGDRVCWNADQNDLGTITEVNWAGVSIKWNNRDQQSVLHNDMTSVFLTSKK
jgi:hypothetical protein